MENGESVKVYKDRWLPCPMPKVLSPRDLGNEACVAGLIGDDSRWNDGLVRKSFDAREVELILSIPICKSAYVDRLLWDRSSNGCFNIKSGY